MYSNQHRSRQLRPTPTYKEFEVDVEFAHRVVSKTVATREYCIQRLWAYVRENNLLVGPNQNILVPDDYLATVLGTEQINVHRGFGKFVNCLFH